jgi:hypothetical protein
MSFPDNENDFVQDEPLPTPPQRPRPSRTPRARARGTTRKVSAASGDAWREAPADSRAVGERARLFLRENPVPTIVGALLLGLAVGFAIHYASSDETKERESSAPLGGFNWSFLSLPFLWPFFRTVKEKYEDSAEVVRGGVDRLKKIDIDDYTKPIRKRWKSWKH